MMDDPNIATRLNPTLSNTQSRKNPGYYDLYPERKAQGPYIPKSTLTPTIKARFDRHPSSSSSSSSSSSYSFSCSSPSSPLSSDTVSGRSKSFSFRHAQISSPSSNLPQQTLSSVSPSRNSHSRSTNSQSSASFSTPSKSHLTLTEKPVSSSARSTRSNKTSRLASPQHVSCTYAASSAALGLARPRATPLVKQPVLSIDEIIRSYPSNLNNKPASQQQRQQKPKAPTIIPSSEKHHHHVPFLPLLHQHQHIPIQNSKPLSASSSHPPEQLDDPDSDAQGFSSDASIDSIQQEIRESLKRSNRHPRRNQPSATTHPLPLFSNPKNPFHTPTQTDSDHQTLSHGIVSSVSDDGLGIAISEKNRTSATNVSRLDVASPSFSDPFSPAMLSPNSSISPIEPFKPSVDHLLANVSAIDREKLTRLLQVRGNHANPIQVSYADVGSPVGHPVFVFLGLGAVRYLVGLYDQVANALGLRLICIDRWGLGQTEAIPFEKRSILAWSVIVSQIAQHLSIGKFSILAHSAGAPYAVGTAIHCSDHIVGPIHLLCPWTGAHSESGYRWLRYVPDGVIRTAQAAEWKLQAWRLGRADVKSPSTPSHNYENTTYWTHDSPLEQSAPDLRRARSAGSFEKPHYAAAAAATATEPAARLKSSDHAIKSPSLTGSPALLETSASVVSSPAQKAIDARESKKDSDQNLDPSKPLRRKPSMFGSLFSSKLNSNSQSTAPPTPSLPLHPAKPTCFEGDVTTSPFLTEPCHRPTMSRSYSFISASNSISSCENDVLVASPPTMGSEDFLNPALPPSVLHRKEKFTTPSFSRERQTTTASSRSSAEPSDPLMAVEDLSNLSNDLIHPHPTTSRDAEVELGIALLRASHAESSKGSADDLQLILGKKPWGFEFNDLLHPCRIWHGSKDDRISLSSSRLLERQVTDCRLTIVQGAGHNLMSNTQVILEVLESIRNHAKISKT